MQQGGLDDEGLGLMRYEDGSIKSHVWNATQVLMHHPEWQGVFRYNEFTHAIDKAKAPPVPKSKTGQIRETDVNEFGNWLTARYKISFGKETRLEAVDIAASRLSYNPARDKLREYQSQWNNEERLDTWLVVHLNADPTVGDAYLRELGRCWLIGLVKRVMHPGCKRDDVLIMLGEQGYRKSTASKVIADAIYPGSFLDTLPDDLGSDEAKRRLQGHIVVELSELESLRKN